MTKNKRKIRKWLTRKHRWLVNNPKKLQFVNKFSLMGQQDVYEYTYLDQRTGREITIHNYVGDKRTRVSYGDKKFNMLVTNLLFVKRQREASLITQEHFHFNVNYG